ncbi:MAG TPA: helix-turn-helix transcriptional regulator [Hyphomicrobiaceae bacterium]|jgi:transcriptional regulator with XRE-family HTH domain|nr:helix-turn-helix transcriptional regulator [Hyphomicrobiaceae bacterium]
MDKPLAPEVRSQFALRLKEMRVQSGFPRARYFAKSLGIEENRYTRYERAEVEPSLTLIHKMCETLRVSPNELLGFAETGGLPLTGLAESAPREDGAAAQDARMRQLGLLAWRLASETVAIRKKHRTAPKGSSDPFATTRETAKLFQTLQNDPFGTVAEIAADDALKNLDSERKADLADLIEAYTEGVAKAVPAPPRG